MKFTAPNSNNFKIVQRQLTDIRNIRLDGVEALRADYVTSTFAVKYLLHPQTNQPSLMVEKKLVNEVAEDLEFTLTEVTVEELDKFRWNGIPSFVLKKGGKLYHARIPHDMTFFSAKILGVHQCVFPKNECRRFSAASDENGGCAKVRNHATYIERYDWITVGFETFNTSGDAFLVANCLHYKQLPPYHNSSKLEVIDVE